MMKLNSNSMQYQLEIPKLHHMVKFLNFYLELFHFDVQNFIMDKTCLSIAPYDEILE